MLAKIQARIDSMVQSRPLAFPWAVFKKFGEDRGGQQAALVAYYTFFSLFPLMLVLVTLLGIVLRNNPDLRDNVLRSALAQFPIVGDQIRENVNALAKSGVGLVIGVVGALWGGLGGVKAMQNSMDEVWDVPVREQPAFITRIVRALLMLVLLGTFTLIGTGLAGLSVEGEQVPLIARIFSFPFSILANVALFIVAFRILTVADVSWGDVIPGAILAGLVWSGLQALGSYIVGNQLKNASELYGFFGIVIGLLSWLYLTAQVTILAAEINVVRKFELWPRSLGAEPVTEADHRALERHATVEERAHKEDVQVEFGGGDQEQERSISP